MTLTFNVFGLEVARINLDIERDEESPVETVVEKAIGTTTKWWLGRLFK